MQLRFATEYTCEEYVSRQGWRDATLDRCPLHPRGGCSLTRHGTYERVKPPGSFIARWYCSLGHCTFSLLPDCFAARLSGSLEQVEAAVALVESAPGREAAADELRLDIELPGALRWIRHRFQPIHAVLTLLKGAMPDRFTSCEPTITSFRLHLATDSVLLALREIAEDLLPCLPPPLGFRPPSFLGGERKRPRQQETGTDPPEGWA